MTDYFDLNNIDDIPEELRKDLKGKAIDAFAARIIQLFQMSRKPLSIDEVMVAYFRLFNDAKDKRAIMTKLYNMSRSKNSQIVHLNKGLYHLKKGV